ncbi:MAG: GPW/gp25 family protein [Bacteroidia bacterium]
MNKPASFLGTGWSFPPTFDSERHEVRMVSEEEDIRQSIIILLSTIPGERPTRPKFGCDLHSLIFDPMIGPTRFLIKDMIETAILYYEPRINLESVDIDTSQEPEGIVQVGLTYTVKSVNVRSNIVFPFYKTEGTSVTDVA